MHLPYLSNLTPLQNKLPPPVLCSPVMPMLSNSLLFYYICGISVATCASFPILMYMMSKLLPKRPVMYGVVIGGRTVAMKFPSVSLAKFMSGD